MAAPLASTPDVNRAVAVARDLPDLVSNLKSIDPALAAQITGKPLLYSKTVYGVPAVGVVTFLAAHYGLGWDQDTCAEVAGAAVWVASMIFRKISTIPITSWFKQKTTAPAAPASSGS